MKCGRGLAAAIRSICAEDLAMNDVSAFTLEEATILANHAAGVVVGKVGTATVSSAELIAALQERKP